jgi:hypothetical protein
MRNLARAKLSAGCLAGTVFVFVPAERLKSVPAFCCPLECHLRLYVFSNIRVFDCHGQWLQSQVFLELRDISNRRGSAVGDNVACLEHSVDTFLGSRKFFLRHDQVQQERHLPPRHSFLCTTGLPLALQLQPQDVHRSVERTSLPFDSCSGFNPGNHIDFAFVNLLKPLDDFSFPC